MTERKASMGDKVYRGDVVKFIRNNISLGTFMKRTVKTADEACWDLCDKLNYVPAIEEINEPHWIPVTERLPKPRESVIISVNGKYGDWIGEGCYWETTENHVIWKGYRWNATYWDDEIIAWMPLPEPYKAVTT